MKSVTVRNVTIGQGKPKICVPLVATTAEGIVAEAKSLLDMPVDIVEWRADWYEDALDKEKVLKAAEELRKVLGDKPLLFTLRTEKEGGEKALLVEDYIEINLAVAASGFVDLVDIELFTAGDEGARMIEEAHKARVKVIMSSHDFFKTPGRESMEGRLLKMQQMGADIPKLAVMPQSKRDVLTLLDVTLEMSQTLECPIVTMSMSSTGMVSRLTGETFGSALTFGAVGQRSAPGQPGAKELAEVLEMIHRNLDPEDVR
ncbi:MAG: type I 3-dehydroquinate dehydratase [Lachnospiraceae bacterium]|jgi:3-dehydroquinate dehydratase-1|nr:type I 3-dehydroquinate dehydratase [Lachnospiraceae bacterium]